jgi:hypothetical protein
MAEIFPNLIDSMWVEITFSMMPPPVGKIYDSSSHRTTIKPIEKGNSFKNEIIEELEKNKKASIHMTIVVEDSIHSIDKKNVNYFRKHFQTAIIDDEKRIDSGEYKIDFSKYKAHKVFNLIYASDFNPKIRDESREYILSKISFSTILFDVDKRFGVLTCERICGLLCGTGYRVYIKKVNDKWVIDKIEEAWIA